MPQATGDGHHVDGGVAAPDDHHPVRGDLQPALVEGLQKSDPAHAIGRVAAGIGKPLAGLGADRQQHGVELALDRLDGDVPTDADAHARLHARVENALELAVHHRARDAIARDAVARHPAQLGALVEDRAGVALAP